MTLGRKVDDVAHEPIHHGRWEHKKRVGMLPHRGGKSRIERFWTVDWE